MVVLSISFQVDFRSPAIMFLCTFMTAMNAKPSVPKIQKSKAGVPVAPQAQESKGCDDCHQKEATINLLKVNPVFYFKNNKFDSTFLCWDVQFTGRVDL